jgi:hypothetical protein
VEQLLGHAGHVSRIVGASLPPRGTQSIASLATTGAPEHGSRHVILRSVWPLSDS